jgi:branched-chain amino acid transport system substrate-binding protein
MNLKFLKIPFAGILAVASGISGVFIPLSSAHADPLRLGVFGPMSGDAAGYGASLKEAVEMMVTAQNAKGGILGNKIEVSYCDDAGKPEQAVSCAQRLTTRDNVSVLLGSISSPASLAASQIALQQKTPQIVISGTAQKITKQGNPWVFRSAVPDRTVAANLVKFISERLPGKRRIGVIYVNDDFGKGGLDSVEASAKNLGMEVVASESYTRGDLDFTAQLTRLRAANPDAIVDWSRYAESALIAKQLTAMKIDTPRFASDADSHPKFRELAGEAANGWYYASPFSEATAAKNPSAAAFLKEYEDTYKKSPNYVHAQTWDAVEAVFVATDKARSTNREAIRDALRSVKFDGSRGSFTFNADGDPNLAISVVLVKDGKETDPNAK